MKRRNFFSGYHPAVNLVYFVLVLGFAMFFWHPVCLLVTLGCSLRYAASLRGLRAATRGLGGLLPLMLLAAVINPLFNHEGATILRYLPTGNPLTLESVVFGFAAAAMLGAVVTWLGCCSVVLTSDKLIWLFGRILPMLSLLLSMALRFMPRFRAQFRAVNEARHSMGRGCGDGSALARLRHAVTVFSILVTWSLENAIETADSMKGRGFGLRGRTAFSIYRMEERDRLALLWLGGCGGFILSGWMAGCLDWRYFPTIRGAGAGAMQIALYLAYLALCLTPVILNRWEERAWNLSRSGR